MWCSRQQNKTKIKRMPPPNLRICQFADLPFCHLVEKILRLCIIYESVVLSTKNIYEAFSCGRGGVRHHAYRGVPEHPAEEGDVITLGSGSDATARLVVDDRAAGSATWAREGDSITTSMTGVNTLSTFVDLTQNSSSNKPPGQEESLLLWA